MKYLDYKGIVLNFLLQRKKIAPQVQIMPRLRENVLQKSVCRRRDPEGVDFCGFENRGGGGLDLENKLVVGWGPGGGWGVGGGYLGLARPGAHVSRSCTVYYQKNCILNKNQSVGIG